MKLLTPAVFLALNFSLPAQVLVSEVLFNEVGGDVAGEWTEIFNAGSSEVSLTGWSIGDEETSGASSATEAMMFLPAGATIGPGEFRIVAANAIVFESIYGFLPDYEAASGAAGDHESVPNLTPDPSWDPDGGIINMSNSNDHAYLRDAGGAVVDRVSWNEPPGTAQFSGGLEADGQSWQRTNPAVDTDSPADWALTPLSEKSTPRRAPSAPGDFIAEWETTPSGLVLKWNTVPGATSYLVRSSTDLQSWADVTVIAETSWTPPTPLPARIFYKVEAF